MLKPSRMGFALPPPKSKTLCASCPVQAAQSELVRSQDWQLAAAGNLLANLGSSKFVSRWVDRHQQSGSMNGKP